MDKKLKIVSGIAAALAASSIYYFFRENNKSQNQKMLDQLNKLKRYIDNHFEECPKEQLSKRLEDRKDFIQLIQEISAELYDIDRVAEEAEKHPYFKNLISQNQQISLFNQEYTSLYLRRNSLEATNQYIENITKKHIIQYQEQPQLSNNAQQFISFIYVALIFTVTLIEETLIDLTNKNSLLQFNYLLSGLLDYIEIILKQYPILNNMIGIAFMGQLQIKELTFGHKCDDQYYQNRIEDTSINKECKCLIFDGITRYISLITPTIQKKLLTLIIDYQIISTVEHLNKLGQILLKNQFYLGSQINQESMYYVPDVSVLNHLIIQSTAYKQVRDLMSQPELLDTWNLYVERLLSQNNIKFIAKVLSSVIATHVMIYPLFSDQESLQKLITPEKAQILISVHFLGVLLILETKETVDIKDANLQLLEWLAGNMDYMLATEVLTFLQIQFLRKIFAYGNPELLFKHYLQCLRVVQNKRIQDKQQHNKKQFETNAALTKQLGYLIITQINELPTYQSLSQIISIIPFQDESERYNIFTNTLRILFDLPTMNFHFLKYVQTKSEKISQEAHIAYQGYYTHVLSASTISFDIYITTLQISLLFGKADALLSEISQRMNRDLGEFEQYQDFLLRDLILLIDIMENPYYLINVLQQSQINFPGKQEIIDKLWINAAISIVKMNEGLTLPQLLETLQLFIHIKEISQSILEILNLDQNGKISLKPQYINNWPYLVLQRDVSSAIYFLNKCDQPFDELIYSTPELPFLFNLRASLFNSEHFISIIKLLLKSQDRETLAIWISKILYYAKQQLLKRGSSLLIDQLFSSDEYKSFIHLIEQKPQYNKLCEYLKL